MDDQRKLLQRKKRSQGNNNRRAVIAEIEAMQDAADEVTNAGAEASRAVSKHQKREARRTKKKLAAKIAKKEAAAAGGGANDEVPTATEMAPALEAGAAGDAKHRLAYTVTDCACVLTFMQTYRVTSLFATQSILFALV